MDIESVKERYTSELMELPNVVGVGTGEKEGRPVIKVFVERKVPAADLRPSELVPATLDGQETDVEEVGILTIEEEKG